MAVPVTVALLTHLDGADPPCCPWCAALPAASLTWGQAARAAAQLGGRLPTSQEWEWMAGSGVRRYPWGDDEPGTGLLRANVRGVGPDGPTPVAAYPHGATPAGIFDVAGNVWEWTSTVVPGGYVVRGGSYRALALYARCGYGNEVPASLASPGIGVRVVRRP
ncbi:formylglycine-generating enzyme family protein [Micromonospora sp. NBC_01813]|uniref:formylglycine-generating enzyme family protein n=1 Tax=Micromonospora sp. NBC_01813 TaxID=2975988 RepID=UPI002DD83BE7|nr:SUMF1/EgtB/PvdO family nonheme iron enzyme [Micromonospora sp. NBC_01813]WSA07045.1 formylglycine-generating enzyme family protein [Micromonospora sp. NBC_01813]